MDFNHVLMTIADNVWASTVTILAVVALIAWVAWLIFRFFSL